MKDNEKLKELFKLSEANPDLEIMFMTYYEVVGDDWGYWQGRLKEIKKDVWYTDDEHMYFGKEDIQEQLAYQIEDSLEEDDPDDKLNKLVDEEYNRLIESKEIKEAINLIVSKNIETLQADIESLEPKERIKVICDLLPFAVPKLQSVQVNENETENKEPVTIRFMNFEEINAINKALESEC